MSSVWPSGGVISHTTCVVPSEATEREQVQSALLQKFRLKINIAAYGGVVGVLVTLGLPHPKL